MLVMLNKSKMFTFSQRELIQSNSS